MTSSLLDPRRYMRLVLLLAGLALALAALGLVPTRQLGGEEAVIAMAVGVAAAWVAVAAGSLPLLMGGGLGWSVVNQVLFATALRFLLVLVLALVLAVAGAWPRTPLLLWLAGGYVALLVGETALTSRRAAAASEMGGS